MVDVFLLIVVAVLAVLLLVAMVLMLILFGHPDDKNTAWFPKIVTVLGLWLAFASLLILPYDVANSKGDGGGVRVDVLWLIVYITMAILIAFLIPFAYFYYESDMDE
jgi:LMBR1 domain-containing protein 1